MLEKSKYMFLQGQRMNKARHEGEQLCSRDFLILQGSLAYASWLRRLDKAHHYVYCGSLSGMKPEEHFSLLNNRLEKKHPGYQSLRSSGCDKRAHLQGRVLLSEDVWFIKWSTVSWSIISQSIRAEDRSPESCSGFCNNVEKKIPALESAVMASGQSPGIYFLLRRE